MKNVIRSLSVLLLLLSPRAYAQTAPQPIGPTGLPVPIDSGVTWTPGMWKAAFQGYISVSNGKAQNTYLDTPTLSKGVAVGTDVSNSVIAPFGGSVMTSIGRLFAAMPSVAMFGAAADGKTADDNAVTQAFSTSPTPDVTFPYSSAGYYLASGIPNQTLGVYRLNGNTFTGPGVGTPVSGGAQFNGTYTNPYNVTTFLKYELDPAALPQGDNVTNQALSVECRNNRPNPLNPNPYRNWIACIYRGLDSGTGGGPGTSINSEVDNDVLNLSSNSAADMEIDVNFNGKVLDGGWSRALFLTGGGATGNNTNSIALDIAHDAYDHSWLPWTTGISLRQAVTMLQFNRTQALEPGVFLQALDENSKEIAHLDKAGGLAVQTVQIQASSTPSVGSPCAKGTISYDDSYLYVCTSSLTFKRVALAAMQ